MRPTNDANDSDWERNMASSRTPVRAMTSREIVHALLAVLSPMLEGQMFRVSNGEEPPLAGISDHVTITWANVPSDAPEIDALNASKSIMLAIDAPEWSQHRIPRAMIGQAPVSSVKVRSFRGRSSFREKTGTPEQIVAYVAEWFRKATSSSSASTVGNRAGRAIRIGGLARVVLPSGNTAIYTDARATPEETMRYGMLVAVRFPDGWRENTMGHWRLASEWDQQAYEKAPMHDATSSSENRTRPRGWREPRAPIPVSPQMVVWMNDYMQKLAKPGEKAQFRFGVSKRGHLTYARLMWMGQGYGSTPRAEVERDLRDLYNVDVQELVDLATTRVS